MEALLNMQELSNKLMVTVKIKGVKRFNARLYLAKFILKIARIISPVRLKIEVSPTNP